MGRQVLEKDNSGGEGGQRGEIACISYWRGLAALGVVAHHVRIELWVGLHTFQSDPTFGNSFDRLAALLSIPTIFMGSGVMLFFVISGFCIHYPFAGKEGRPLRLGEYLTRRAIRIYPPYLMALLFTIFVQLATSVHMDWETNFLSSLLFQNFLGVQPHGNPALWTIPVEVQLYLAFPLIFALIRSSWRTALFLCLGVSLVSITLNLWTSIPIELSFLPYWFTWTVGAVLAEKLKSGTLRQPGYLVALLGAAAFVFGLYSVLITKGGNPDAWGHNLAASTGYLGFGIAFGVLVWWSVLNRRFFDGIPVRIGTALGLLGSISYSLYLFHMPLFGLMGNMWKSAFGHAPVNYLMTIPFIAVAIGFAWVAYKIVEEPSHNFGRRLSRYLFHKS